MDGWPSYVRGFAEQVVRGAARVVAIAATSDGRRSSLAWAEDALFAAMAEELQRRGVTRLVAANMFAMSRRTFNRHVKGTQQTAWTQGRAVAAEPVTYARDPGADWGTRRWAFEHLTEFICLSHDATERLRGTANALFSITVRRGDEGRLDRLLRGTRQLVRGIDELWDQQAAAQGEATQPDAPPAEEWRMLIVEIVSES